MFRSNVIIIRHHCLLTTHYMFVVLHYLACNKIHSTTLWIPLRTNMLTTYNYLPIQNVYKDYYAHSLITTTPQKILQVFVLNVKLKTYVSVAIFQFTFRKTKFINVFITIRNWWCDTTHQCLFIESIQATLMYVLNSCWTFSWLTMTVSMRQTTDLRLDTFRKP
jgi:hypothetical protein